MHISPTYEEIAGSWGLWMQYIDTGAEGTREEWDTQSMADRIAFIVACCGPEDEQPDMNEGI